MWPHNALAKDLLASYVASRRRPRIRFSKHLAEKPARNGRADDNGDLSDGKNHRGRLMFATRSESA
jgi:hypothetical protein